MNSRALRQEEAIHMEQIHMGKSNGYMKYDGVWYLFVLYILILILPIHTDL